MRDQFFLFMFILFDCLHCFLLPLFFPFLSVFFSAKNLSLVLDLLVHFDKASRSLSLSIYMSFHISILSGKG